MPATDTGRIPIGAATPTADDHVYDTPISVSERALIESLADLDEALATGRAVPRHIDNAERDRIAADQYNDAATIVELLRASSQRLIASAAPNQCPQVAASVPHPDRIGRYEIEAAIGEGAMGVVYRARDPSLGRKVAVKLLRLTDDLALARFRFEAAALATVQHPNIVQIFDQGIDAGQPFLVMEYIEGQSLKQRLNRSGLPERQAVGLITTIAGAIAIAHEAGVIHRDLKPSNILIGPGDIPKVTDFGLAKRVESEAELTSIGAAVGTPSYMSPEQASGDSHLAGPAADIYALGAILYELLTGRPPFQSLLHFDVYRQIVQDEPISVRRLNPTVSRDLVTICHKCLEKKPASRYATAKAIAEDLDRFLTGRPIVARPIGTVARMAKWSRRHPWPTATMLLFQIGFALVAWQSIRANREWTRAELERSEAAKSQRAALFESGRSTLDFGISLCEKGDINGGLREMVRGLERSIEAGDLDAERVARTNLGAWQRHLIRPGMAFPHKSWIWAVAFSPDGETVLTGSYDQSVQRWNARSGGRIGEPLRHPFPVWAATYSPDGMWIATDCCDAQNQRGEARIWQASTGKPISPAFAHTGAVVQMNFVDGRKRLLAASEDQVRIWDTATMLPACPPIAHRSDKKVTILCAKVSPDSRWLTTVGADGRILRWDTKTGGPLGEAMLHRQCAVVAISPDGLTMVSGGTDGTLIRWDQQTGKATGNQLVLAGPVMSIKFNSDGRSFAVACKVAEDLPVNSKHPKTYVGDVRIFNTASMLQVMAPLKHPLPSWDMAFSPDSRLLLTGCQDGYARFWDLWSHERRGLPAIHRGNVVAVTFSADGKQALTADAGGGAVAARLWEIQPTLEPAFSWPNGPLVDSFCFGSDGKLLLTGDRNGQVRIWSCDNLRQIADSIQCDSPVEGLSMSADGKAFWARVGSDIRVWDRYTRRELLHCAKEGSVQMASTLSADGSFMLTGDNIGILKLWRLKTGAHRNIGQMDSAITALAFHPTNGMFVVATRNRQLQVVKLDGLSVGKKLTHAVTVTALAFSPDGSEFAAGTEDGVVRLWNSESLSSVRSAMPHSGPIHSIQFDPDGTRLLVGFARQGIRIWDVATTKPLMPAILPATSASFDPDGRRLAVTGVDRQIRWFRLPMPIADDLKQLRQKLTDHQLPPNSQQSTDSTRISADFD